MAGFSSYRACWFHLESTAEPSSSLAQWVRHVHPVVSGSNPSFTSNQLPVPAGGGSQTVSLAGTGEPSRIVFWAP